MPKLYLNHTEVEALRAHAMRNGRSETWFEQWLEDCVIIVEPLPTSKWSWLKRIFRR